MASFKEYIKGKWGGVKASPRFRNICTFLIFVVIAILFWFIMAINDNVTRNLRVSVKVDNIPSAVTFINDPPQYIQVTVRDKGTNILRSGVLRNLGVNINFNDYAHDGTFRLSRNDLMALLRHSLGANIQISSLSTDSLRLHYTDKPGKVVPVIARVDVTASSGNIIAGPPILVEKSVKVYSYGDQSDTVSRVYTEVLTKRNLSQSTTFSAKLQPIPGVKILPPMVRVRIPVEPLVVKEGYAQVETRGVPVGESLLLFPNRVPITYYVPMNRFSETTAPIKVIVDYEDTKATKGNKLPVRIVSWPDYIVSPELKNDSVEYTLVRN